MKKECPFCNIPKNKYVEETELVYAKRDIYPASEGHTLIIPKRHIATFFQATQEERIDLINVLEKAKAELQSEYSPDGFNIGINEGVAGGQTVMHISQS